MGRRSNTYETYELSAFTEQVLLDAGEGNGSNLGVGDSFTMPTDTNAVITVSDNDGTLSGDSRRNENSDDRRGQEATITVDGEEVGGTGQIYAEKFFWVCDEAGNWYIMLEIEQEDSSGDYFVFYDYCGLPDEGAELSIVCSRNISRCWEPRYDDMMQEPPFAPPIALNDLISITEDDTIGDASADAQLNVLANDFDVDSSTFSLTSVTDGAVGQAFNVTTANGVTVSVTIAADGTLTFDTDGQFDTMVLGETDSFTIEYTISDEDGGSNSAEVTVVINGTTDGPVAVADSFTTTETGTITGNILTNDEGNDAGDLSVVSIDANGETYEPGDSFTVTTDGGRTGTVTVEADGSLTFTTDGNFDDLTTDQTDTVTLSYTVAGANQGDNLIVNGDFESHGELTRGYGDNRWDVFNSIEGWSTPNGQLEIQQGSHGGTPQNSTTNSVIELDSHDDCDTNASISQTVTIGEDGVYELSFDYSPRQLGNLIGETSGISVIVDGEVIASFSSDTLGYESYSFSLDLGAGDHTVGFAGNGVDDTFGALLDNVELRQSLTDTAEVTLTIVGENEGPVAADDGFAVTEDGSTFAAVTGDVLANDTDADGDALSVTGVNGDAAAVGQVVNVTSDTNGFAATVTIAADGSITLNASDEFAAMTTGESDTVTVSYEVSDGAGGTDTATVTLTVNGGNEGPVAADDSFEITEDGSTFAAVTGDVLANDTDADGDALSVTGVNGDAAAVGQVVNVTSDTNGYAATVTIAADGSITLNASDEFAAMTTGESDTVTVSYEVSDGAGGTDTATVTLTVNGGNEGPVAADDSFEITEAGATFADVTGNVLTNDTDADGDALTVTGVNGDAAAVGQSISVVSDTNGFAATVTIAADGTITLSASDEFAALTDNETDTVTVSYEVSDGAGGVDTATVVLSVNGVNQAPVAVDDAFETTETAAGFETITGNLLANDSDPDGDTFTITAIDGYAGNVGELIEWETDEFGLLVELTVQADGSIALTPGSDVASQLTEGESDVVEFTYEITDSNGATSQAIASLVINGANIAPDAQDLSFTSTEQTDGTIPEVTGNLLATATDADSDNLTVSAVNGDAALVGDEISLTSNENGFDVSVIVDSNGDITLSPGQDFADLDQDEEETVSLTYQVSDGNGGFDEANVTLTVTGIEGNGGGNGGGDDNISYNVVFLVDTSGSATSTTFSGDENTFFENVSIDQQNLNDDLVVGSHADAELYTVQQISNQIADLNLSDDIDIGVYTSNLEATGTGTFVGAQGLADADGNVMFEAGADLTDIFAGTDGNGSMVYNSAVSGANEWLTVANADDQYDTTVNIVYVLSASTGLDFPAFILDDADADLNGELAQMDAAFDFTIDTIYFDGEQTDLAPQIATLETFGDGVTNLVGDAADFDGVIAGVADTLDGAATAAATLIDDVLDTTTNLIDDLVS